MKRERGVEARERAATGRRAARRLPSRAQERVRERTAHGVVGRGYVPLKRASKLRVCGLGLPDRGRLDALPHTEEGAPCRVDLSHRRVRGDPRDFTSRDVELMSVLERSPGLRGLAGVHAIEDEGLGEIGAIACREDTRPQVVVLALEGTRT